MDILVSILLVLAGWIAGWASAKALEGRNQAGVLEFDCSTAEHRPHLVVFEPIEALEGRKAVTFKVIRKEP